MRDGRWLMLLSLLGVLVSAAQVGAVGFDMTVLNIPSLTYGIANESCETPTGGDVTLTTASAWESTIESAAPGTRFFLHTGTYTTSTLTIPNATSSQRIQLKPYNCEAVTIDAIIEPGNYTTIAGFALRHFNSCCTDEGTIYFGDSRQPTFTGVIIRNNSITSTNHFGLSNFFVTTTDLTVQGNHFFSTNTADTRSNVTLRGKGLNTVFRANRFTNTTATGGEDAIGPVNWSGTYTFTRNWFEANNREDYMDIKFSSLGESATMTVSENYFDGTVLPLGACILVQNASDMGINSGYQYTVTVTGNYFYHCNNNTIEHTIHDLDADHRFLILTYNIFNQVDTSRNSVVVQSDNANIQYNTFLSGSLKTQQGGIDPLNVVVKNNIFYQNGFIGFGTIDVCANNDFFSTSPGSCASSLTSDPLFVNAASDWRLQVTSPMRGAGEGGTDIGAIPFAAAGPDITSNLIAWWKLDEPSGSSATDSSGNSHTGTLINTPTRLTPCQVNGCLTFLGGSSNTYITVPDAVDLDVTGDLTIGFWFKLTSAGNDDILLHKEDLATSSMPWSLDIENTGVPHLRSYHHTNGSSYLAGKVFATYTLPLGAWHHAALVRTVSGGTLDLYIDGSFVEQQTYVTDLPAANAGVVGIGGLDAGGLTTRSLDGSLDEIRLYGRALTAADVASLKNYGLTAGTVPVVLRLIR